MKHRQLTRFKDRAYSGCYRSDGQLLVAGGEIGTVQIFQTNSRAVLRQLKAHQRPVHVARFSPDKLHVLSASDDATVRPEHRVQRVHCIHVKCMRLDVEFSGRIAV